MFGYLIANKPELKIKEYERYRKFYCGICLALKKKSGAKAQLSLSFDMTLVALVLTALYEPESRMDSYHCPAHMGEKIEFLTNEYIDYAADMNTLLAYYKCIDDWHDERSVKGRAYQLILKKDKKRIAEKYPEKVADISRALKRIWELEAAEGPVDMMRLDDLASASGKLLETVFAMKDDVWKQELSLMGFSLGKYVYLLDAYDDLEEDIREGVFNPLKDMKDEPDFDGRIYRLLMLAAADATAAFERLPVLMDAELIRNILYAGIWSKYRNKAKMNKGEHDSE